VTGLRLDGTWIIDLDGVVWLSAAPVPGGDEAVSAIRAAGGRVVFATNNSAPTHGALVARLHAAGIEAEPCDLVTSADAVASMLSPGERTMVVGDEGILEALENRGVLVPSQPPFDAVVVGWTRRFDFDVIAEAAQAVRRGARLLGTNDDPTHPTPERLLPGSGAILAAVATAAQTDPEVAGKPHAPTVSLLRERAPDALVVVGDRPSTDGRLAERLELPFALVRSGVTRPDDSVDAVVPDFDASDLLDLVGSCR
jgi:4-nitrophenyl phosphatase